MRRLSPSIPLQLVVLFCFAPGAAGPSAAEGPSTAAVLTPGEIEADWLAQIRLRYQPQASLTRNAPLPYSITAEQDAAGGCDGVINGTWGFHTELDDKPWWCVDLQGRFPLERVVIHNSGHEGEWKRILGFSLLLSLDGKSWTEAFRHDGKAFQDSSQPIVVPLAAAARYVKIQLPGREHLTLEEVEVYPVGKTKNVALKKPANQSSASKWSVLDWNPWSSDPMPPQGPVEYPVAKIVEQGLRLAADLGARGVGVEPHAATLTKIGRRLEDLPAETPEVVGRDLYIETQWAVRRLAFSNPLLDFENLLFVKRAPNLLLCHCDEYLSWWSRPGGELCLLEGFVDSQPKLKSLSGALLPEGDIIRPEISYDGGKVLFSHCRHYPDLWKKENKLDKATIPEDAFYHLYEMNLDGSGLRQLRTRLAPLLTLSEDR